MSDGELCLQKILIHFRLVSPEWRHQNNSYGIWRRNIIFLLFWFFYSLLLFIAFVIFKILHDYLMFQKESVPR